MSRQTGGGHVRRVPLFPIATLALFCGCWCGTLFGTNTRGIAAVSLVVAISVLICASVSRRLIGLWMMVALCAVGGWLGVLRDAVAWESVLVRCGTTDFTQRHLVHLEGIVASTPRTDERAFRHELLACGALDEDVLARFVPSEPSTRFLLHAERSIGEDGTLPVDALVQVAVSSSAVPCTPGERIRIHGWLRGFGPPRNPGGFDMVGWAHDRRIAGSLQVERADLIQSVGQGHTLNAWVARWRGAVDESLRRAVASDHLDASALVAASTTGASLPGLRSVARTFAACGIQHLVAISGFNFAVLSGAVMCCLGVFRAPPRLVGVVLIALAALFVLSIEPEVSSLRAAWMGGCVALMGVLGRRVPFSVVLSISLMLLLIADPLSARDPGLQLSFAAILGLRIGAEHVQRWMSRVLRGPHLTMVLLRRVLQPLWAAIGAWTATLPVIWMHFGSVPLLCIPCTLLLSPAFALMIVLANAAVALDPIWRWGGHMVGQAAVLDARLVLGIARETAQWPGALPTPARGWAIKDEIPWRVRIDMLDVGNGSCHLIRCDGACVLYDCGSLGATAAGSRTVLPALFALGVESIDCVIISHPNIDHFGALPEIVRGIDVGEVIVSDAFLRWSDQEDGPVAAAVRAVGDARVPIRCVRAGDVASLGAMRVSVIHPPGDDRSLDANDGSLVIRVDAGAVSILMTGDLARKGCPLLLASGEEMLSGVHVLELPHHGSFQPAAAALVERIQAPVVLQSTGQQRWQGDRWEPLLDGSIRLVTARDRACAVLLDDAGLLHVGRWEGTRYTWSATDIRLPMGPDSVGVDEQGPREHDGIARWSIPSFFDFDFKRTRNDWQRDRKTRIGARHRLTKQFPSSLTDNEHHIAPSTQCEWNLRRRRQGGEPLGDFVDEPYRPPKCDGCRREGGAPHICNQRRFTVRTRERRGRWIFNPRRLIGKRSNPRGLQRDAFDVVGHQWQVRLARDERETTQCKAAREPAVDPRRIQNRPIVEPHSNRSALLRRVHECNPGNSFNGHTLNAALNLHLNLGAHRLHKSTNSVAIAEHNHIRFRGHECGWKRLELDPCRLIDWQRDHSKTGVLPTGDTPALGLRKTSE
ncbi:MAG: DUF4131 domain-containing protein [Phycisphaerae bacterium]|nr:DUF4131 domain-containing protein [Phycisphaerae bacterium]